MIVKLHNGSIELPKELREQAVLKEGDAMDCIFFSNTIYLLPIRTLPACGELSMPDSFPPYFHALRKRIAVFSDEAYGLRKALSHPEQESA